MAFQEYAAFFDDFGVDATISGGAVRGIFDAAFLQTLSFVEGSNPAFLAATADVSAATAGTAVTIDSVAYTVTGVQPDGTGMTLLTLQEA